MNVLLHHSVAMLKLHLQYAFLYYPTLTGQYQPFLNTRPNFASALHGTMTNKNKKCFLCCSHPQTKQSSNSNSWS